MGINLIFNPIRGLKLKDGTFGVGDTQLEKQYGTALNQ